MGNYLGPYIRLPLRALVRACFRCTLRFLSGVPLRIYFQATPGLGLRVVLVGSWDFVSTLIGVISIVTLMITLVTKSHDPLSRGIRVPPRVPFQGVLLESL